jgi:hypothetical protein
MSKTTTTSPRPSPRRLSSNAVLATWPNVWSAARLQGKSVGWIDRSAQMYSSIRAKMLSRTKMSCARTFPDKSVGRCRPFSVCRVEVRRWDCSVVLAVPVLTLVEKVDERCVRSGLTMPRLWQERKVGTLLRSTTLPRRFLPACWPSLQSERCDAINVLNSGRYKGFLWVPLYQNPKNLCIFPCYRESIAESGSRQTASTAIPAKSFYLHG